MKFSTYDPCMMTTYRCTRHLQGEFFTRGLLGLGVVKEVLWPLRLVDHDLDFPFTLIQELPTRSAKLNVRALYTYLVTSVPSVVDTNGAAVGTRGPFILKDDGKVAALDEDVAGDRTLLPVRQKDGLPDGLVVQVYTESHGFRVGSGG